MGAGTGEFYDYIKSLSGLDFIKHHTRGYSGPGHDHDAGDRWPGDLQAGSGD
jgi:hypothetical protein